MVKLFYADWCGHCRKFKSTWEEFKQFTKDNSVIKDKNNRNLSIKTQEFNSESEDPDIVMEMRLERIEGYPTIIIYKNKKERDMYSGERTMNGLKKYFNIQEPSYQGQQGLRQQGQHQQGQHQQGQHQQSQHQQGQHQQGQLQGQKGGYNNNNYYNKYMKYKLKYLKLKY